MILPGFGSSARNIASGVLMLLGMLTHAKAQTPTEEKIASAQLESALPEAVIKDSKAGDTLVKQRGIASWYGRAWRGRRTASGARYDDREMTAAHQWLPFATQAHVTNLQNGRSVDVVVTDRGPFHAGRIIDLSERAAEALGIKQCGIAEVVVNAQF